MKLSFNTENDFDSTYYLPGYDCVVHVEVLDGIVTLTVDDDPATNHYEEPNWDEEKDDDWGDDEEWDDDLDEALDEWDDDEFLIPSMPKNDEEECDYHCEHCHCDKHACENKEDDAETEIEITEDVEENLVEEKKEEPSDGVAEFVNKIAEIDSDGVLMKLLTSILEDEDAKKPDSKLNRTLGKIIQGMTALMKK